MSDSGISRFSKPWSTRSQAVQGEVGTDTKLRMRPLRPRRESGTVGSVDRRLREGFEDGDDVFVGASYGAQHTPDLVRVQRPLWQALAWQLVRYSAWPAAGFERTAERSVGWHTHGPKHQAGWRTVDPVAADLRDAATVEHDLSAAVATLHASESEFALNQRRRDVVAKAGRVVPAMVATVSFCCADSWLL